MSLAAKIHAHLAEVASDGGSPMDLNELQCAFRQCSAKDVDAAVGELAKSRKITAGPNGYRITIQKQQELFA